MSEIAIRLFDTTLEQPAASVKVSLEVEAPDGAWRPAGRGVTNEAGSVAFARIPVGSTSRLVGAPVAGYRLSCAIGVYFARTGAPGAFPKLMIHFADDGGGPAPRLRIEVGPRAYRVIRED